jgi:hypothetical protein
MNMTPFSILGRFLMPAAFVVLLGSHCVADDIEVGKPFPMLMLPSLDGGQPLSVASFEGQKRVLHIWASW